MARLLVHVEGQTEESFVNEVLRNHLLARGYHSVAARIVGNARLRQRRGGIRPWPSVRRDILSHLWEDANCIATTMIDCYGLPAAGEGAWPGRENAAGPNADAKAARVEEGMLEALTDAMGGTAGPRFIPFVVMHEFEGLLFSDCSGPQPRHLSPDLELDFSTIRDQFATPEEINDSPQTAPSKRVQALLPNYEKPLLGTLAILEIGLAQLRAECPHFNNWLVRLESLGR